jgi:2-(1,2-epoxy-1,2-dihydrophenyl)acetyl-CoA isomerase
VSSDDSSDSTDSGSKGDSSGSSSSSSGASYEHLLIDTTANGVRTITLNRPERLNAVNPRLSEELPHAVCDAAVDDAVRVVVVTGAGRGFCAGLDLAEPVAIGQGSRATRTDPYYWVGRWVKAVTECEKPVIAAVNGAAAGAGFGLTLACDLRLVSAGARCTAGYVRRGLSPDAGVSWFLPRLVGHSRAMDIVLTGRDVTAEEALRIGLATMTIPDEEFAAGVARYAAMLAGGPPIAVALTKRLMLASATATLDAQLREEIMHIKTCFATADVREAVKAFGEKRMPVFTGN